MLAASAISLAVHARGQFLAKYTMARKAYSAVWEIMDAHLG
jgi:hypothetical protein